MRYERARYIFEHYVNLCRGDRISGREDTLARRRSLGLDGTQPAPFENTSVDKADWEQGAVVGEDFLMAFHALCLSREGGKPRWDRVAEFWGVTPAEVKKAADRAVDRIARRRSTPASRAKMIHRGMQSGALRDRLSGPSPPNGPVGEAEAAGAARRADSTGA